MRPIAATRRGDKFPRLHCCCDQSLALSLSLRYVAQIQTSLNLCDRSQRRNSVAATMIFTCHTRRFVAATCRGDVSQQFVASCVSAYRRRSLSRPNTLKILISARPQGKRANCCVANAFSTRSKLIWLKSSLKTTKMSKKRIFGKKPRE